jgi:flagellar protein FliL
VSGKSEGEDKSGDGEASKGGGDGGGGKNKMLLIVGPLVLVIVLGAVYFLFLKGGSSDSGEPKKVVHNPGAVVKVDPITINLTGGHFLKLGITLQPEAGAAEVDGSKALDAAIDLFSNLPITELSTKEGRNKLKAELVAKVSEAYEKEVYDIYFTEFVYQ